MRQSTSIIHKTKFKYFTSYMAQDKFYLSFYIFTHIKHTIFYRPKLSTKKQRGTLTKFFSILRERYVRQFNSNKRFFVVRM